MHAASETLGFKAVERQLVKCLRPTSGNLSFTRCPRIPMLGVGHALSKRQLLSKLGCTSPGMLITTPTISLNCIDAGNYFITVTTSVKRCACRIPRDFLVVSQAARKLYEVFLLAWAHITSGVVMVMTS